MRARSLPGKPEAAGRKETHYQDEAVQEVIAAHSAKSFLTATLLRETTSAAKIEGEY